MDILNYNSLQKIVKKIRPKIILHTAGLSRPMNIHEKNISKSIDLNIVGTCNVVKICKKITLNLSIFLLVMFMKEQKETIKKMIL